MLYLCNVIKKEINIIKEGSLLKRIKKMLQKGTENYKKAQKIANDLIWSSEVTKISSMEFEMYFEKISRFLLSIKNTNTFGSKIAETIDNAMEPYSYQVAKISDKQAWILACTAVENNIEYLQ
jgi:hypothetical protein